ncbi:sensor histidine kinase [Actinopolyspora mortivallis]|uniref:sensor histidine kinase n=1 Tax=Actinopolyspora mortivallis TaxID=33906 RepID=UPI002158B6F4|nr:HAMP domain-containing sensor histidine kinase [Actinopolyspora mortivallis]
MSPARRRWRPAVRTVRNWWNRRTVQTRVTLVAALAALVGVTVLVVISGTLLGWLSLESIDTRLRTEARRAASALSTGTAAREVATPGGVRVLDTAGEPVDGLGPTGLRPWEINTLKTGEGVTGRGAPDGDASRVRWRGTVVPDPSGRPLLVLARSELAVYHDVRSTADRVLVPGALCGVLFVAVATWAAVRAALRPVRRMRLAAAELPVGQRLPVPEADDELRGLALATNEMLDRRDADTERLRRFTGDAAHELRNPVGAIRTQAEVAVLHPDPELAQQTLREISEEALRLSELVDGLLAVARAEAGAGSEGEPVDLVAAARSAVERARSGQERVRIGLVTPFPTAPVLATPSEVSTVLDNLLANATRFARALVRVSVLPAADVVRVVVDDDGPGIPPEHREKVFDRFHRVDPSRAGEHGGAGLGLALVAGTVRGRGGAVRADSAPEGGARIEVRWPPAGSAE